MSRISVRGFAVASATAVTTVGAVVGVASGNADTATNDLEATAATGEATLLAEIPAGQQAEVQTASLAQQADAQAAAADSAATKYAEESARKKAAKDAIAKKEAAEAAAKKAAEEKAAKEKAEREAKERAEREAKAAKERASRSEVRSNSAVSSGNDFAQQSSYTVAQVQAMARQIVPADQFQCFSNIVDHESSWNYKATNPSSGAYGLMQALPGSKMSSTGADWRTNPATQLKWGLSYMNGRYGSPCGAWSFWQANNWY
ncbi:aggregation-promoting factor C-terminal-like domain-containing protein [Streptomyces sp. O3]